MLTNKLEAVVGSYDPYTRSVEIVASTTNKVAGVALKSWDITRFQKNPCVLWSHDASKIPVGLAREVTFDDQGLRMRVFFGSAKANPCAEQLSHCVAEGLVRAVSVGYTEEDGTNVLDEVSFCSLGMDEDAGTPHIALDHPDNANVMKRAITPFATGFENAREQAAAALAVKKPDPPIALPLTGAEDAPRTTDPVDTQRDMEGGGDEESEERMHRTLRDAANTLKLHYARVKRAEAEGMCRADCLEMFDTGMATIRIETPKGDEHFDKGWLGLFGSDKTPAPELSTKASAATAKAEKASLDSEVANGHAVSAHEAFSRGETSIKGETMGAESFEIPNHAPDVIGKYKEAIEASDAAARAHDAASRAHQDASDKHGAETPEGKRHGDEAVAHSNRANEARSASVGMRDSIQQVKVEDKHGSKASGNSAHEFLSGVNEGGVTHASSGGGGHSGQSRDDHGRFDDDERFDAKPHVVQEHTPDGIKLHTFDSKKEASMHGMAMRTTNPQVYIHEAGSKWIDPRARAATPLETHTALAAAHKATAEAIKTKGEYASSINHVKAEKAKHMEISDKHAALASAIVGNTPAPKAPAPAAPPAQPALKKNFTEAERQVGHEHMVAGNQALEKVLNTYHGESAKVAGLYEKAADSFHKSAASGGSLGLGVTHAQEEAVKAHKKAAEYFRAAASGTSDKAQKESFKTSAAEHAAAAKSGLPVSAKAASTQSGSSGATSGADAIHAAAAKEATTNGGGGGHGSGQSRDDHGRWDAADCDHFDSGKLGKVDRTQVGGARVPARLSRTGVLTYRNPDGTVRRELRLAEEIFKADSLKTLEHAPVIDIQHHTGMVTPETFRSVSLGHVTGVRQEGKFIVGDLLVQDQHTLDGIDNEERTDVSLGYRCVLDMTPGVYEGEPYDCVQRNIRYNHAALCPPGRGRAGTEVGLRLDSIDSPVTAPSYWWSANLNEGETVTMTTKIRVDGRDFDFGSEAHVEKLNETIKNLRLDSKEAIDKLAVVTKEKDTIEGERDSLKATQEKITLDAAAAAEKDAADKPAFDEMQKERRRHRRKMERIALRYFGDDSEGDDKAAPAAPTAAAGAPTAGGAGPTAAEPAPPPKGAPNTQKRDFPPGAKAPPFGKKDGGAGPGGPPEAMNTDAADVALEALEERIDSMSDRELLVFCIGKRVENFDATNRTDDYLQARFDSIVEVERAGRGIAGIVTAARNGVQNLDAQEDDEVSKARRARDERAASAWKTNSAK